MSVPHAIPSRFRPYSVAILADLVAFLLSSLLLPLIHPTVFAPFYPAVMLSTLYGGAAPGTLAVVLAAIATRYFFLAEPYSPVVADGNALIRLLVLTAIAFMIVGVSSRLRVAHQRAKVTAAQLKKSQDLFQQFMAHSPMTAFIKDAEGRYLYANPLMEQRLGRDRSDWYNQTDFDLFPLAVAQARHQTDQTVLATGEAIKTVEPEAGSGGDRNFLSFNFPLHQPDGPVLVAGMGLDITERPYPRSL